MIAKIRTSTILGIEATSVDAEVYTKNGVPRFTIIGLGDNAVREARDRVTAALKQSGFKLPGQVLVNLAPAEIKKEGSSFDLAIALGILSASSQIKAVSLAGVTVHGELSLDGKLKPVRGVAALTIEALQNGSREILLPFENKREAEIISGIRIIGLKNLNDAVAYLKGDFDPEDEYESLPVPERSKSPFPKVRLSDVIGQQTAKRALTIAAAGGHNLLMIGPPGCGKSMLAQRFASLLPPMTRDETLEVVRIHGIAGLEIERYLEGIRPFRSPHHIVSDVGLIGGGPYPKPGEVSLAHRGVLFLDELAEYRRSVLEALRAPLEAGKVNITRAKASLEFPADFQLIAAMNPCPCGRLGVKGMSCRCSGSAVSNYLNKISQPILDRIDIHVELQAVPMQALTKENPQAKLHTEEDLLHEQVREATARQHARYGKLNAALESSEVKEAARLDKGGLSLLEQASKKGALSARTYIRVLKVSRTIADIEGEERVSSSHVAEAIGFRCLERIQRLYAAA